MPLDSAKTGQIKKLVESTIASAHRLFRGQHSFVNLFMIGCDEFYGFYSNERTFSTIAAINKSLSAKGLDIELSNIFFDSDMLIIYEFVFFDTLDSHVFYFKPNTGEFREIELINFEMP